MAGRAQSWVGDRQRRPCQVEVDRGRSSTTASMESGDGSQRHWGGGREGGLRRGHGVRLTPATAGEAHQPPWGELNPSHGGQTSEPRPWGISTLAKGVRGRASATPSCPLGVTSRPCRWLFSWTRRVGKKAERPIHMNTKGVASVLCARLSRRPECCLVLEPVSTNQYQGHPNNGTRGYQCQFQILGLNTNIKTGC